MLIRNILPYMYRAAVTCLVSCAILPPCPSSDPTSQPRRGYVLTSLPFNSLSFSLFILLNLFLCTNINHCPFFFYLLSFSRFTLLSLTSIFSNLLLFLLSHSHTLTSCFNVFKVPFFPADWPACQLLTRQALLTKSQLSDQRCPDPTPVSQTGCVVTAEATESELCGRGARCSFATSPEASVGWLPAQAFVSF